MRRLIVIIAVVVFCGGISQAQSLHWESVNGPSSAAPSLVAVNTNGHVVMQLRYLWWTSDTGKHWKEYALNAAIRDSGWNVRTLLTFSRSGLAFVSQVDLSGTEPSHLFRIAEGREYCDTLRRDFWRALTSDEAGRVIAVTKDSLFITMDDGATWTPSACPRSESINSIASNGRSNFVLATESGLFLSTNSGQNWRRILSGIAQTHYGEVQWKDGRFWALGDSTYFSDDEGATWSLLPVESSGGRELMHVAATRSDTLAAIRNLQGERTTAFLVGNEITESRNESVGNGHYAIAIDSSFGVWSALSGNENGYASIAPLARTTHVGDTNWNLVPGPGARAQYLFGTAKALIAVSGDNLSAHRATPFANYLYASSDSGTTWIKGGDVDLRNAQYSADSAGVIYKGTAAGHLSYTVDLGQSWKQVDAAFPSNVPITATSWRGALYAASRGVFQSLDGGITWSQIDDGSLTSDVTKLQHTDSVLVAATANGLFVSRNGRSWTNIASSFGPDVLSTSRAGIVESYDSELRRSTDNGATWQFIRYNRRIQDIAIDSVGGIFVCSDLGVDYVMPGSRSYIPLNDSLGDRNVAHIAILPSGAIFVSKDAEGLYRAIGTTPSLSVHSSVRTPFVVCAPNPASTTLQLTMPDPSAVTELAAYNEIGRSWKLNRLDRNTFDVHELPDGVYMLRITSGQSSSVCRVVIQH